MIEMNLIQAYGSSSAEKRIDIIRNNYPDFLEIVDGYIEGLCYMINCEMESRSNKKNKKTVVRMQTNGLKSSFAQKKSIRSVITREALIKCDFSGGVLDGVDRFEDYTRVAKILREMRRD